MCGPRLLQITEVIYKYRNGLLSHIFRYLFAVKRCKLAIVFRLHGHIWGIIGLGFKERFGLLVSTNLYDIGKSVFSLPLISSKRQLPPFS